MVFFAACPRCQTRIQTETSYCKACALPLNEKTLENLARHQRQELAETKAELGYSSAFRYPLRGSGLVLLAVGTLFFGLMHSLPGSGLFSLLGSGYIAAYMFKIITDTARGQLEPVDFPDFTNLFDDVLLPMIRMLLVNLFCFAPAALAFYFGFLRLEEGASPLGPGLLVALLGLLGLAYLPLALLSVAMNGSILGVYPGIVLRLLAHLRGEYAAVLGVLLGSVLLEMACNGLLGRLPLLGGLITGCVGLYFTMVNMHIIGLIFYKHRDDLLTA